MSDIFQVSQSKIKKWINCRKAYHYQYVEGLKKRIKARPLTFGIIFHEMLDAVANGRDPIEVLTKYDPAQLKTFREEKEIYGEIIEDATYIMEAYADYYRDEELTYIKYNGQYAEHWFSVMLTDDIRLVAKMDAFTHTPNGLRWLTENKTGAQIPDEDSRWRDLQTAVYVRICESLDLEPFDGLMWNYIVSKPPTRPSQNKDGTISGAHISTLPNVVEAVFEELGVVPRTDPKAKKIIREAEENVPKYFKRVYSTVNRAVVDNLFEDFVSYAEEARDGHGIKQQRNIGRHCSWCDFEAICRTELQDNNSDSVKRRDYVRKDRSKEEAHNLDRTKAKKESVSRRKKKVTGKKKALSKKTARKKPARRKAARKKTARKKTTRKKTARKKTRKKTARKAPRRRKAARKKTTRRQARR